MYESDEHGGAVEGYCCSNQRGVDALRRQRRRAKGGAQTGSNVQKSSLSPSPKEIPAPAKEENHHDDDQKCIGVHRPELTVGADDSSRHNRHPVRLQSSPLSDAVYPDARQVANAILIDVENDRPQTIDFHLPQALTAVTIRGRVVDDRLGESLGVPESAGQEC